MSKVLITGGAGFIGSNVAEHFKNNGYEVIALDNLSRASILGKSVGDPLYNWKRISGLGVKTIKADVRDAHAVEEAAKGADVIMHMAAQVAVTTSITDPRTDFEINVIGTFNALEAARKNDSVFIFTSTNKVYGENVNRIPVKEIGERYEFSDPKYVNGIPEDFPVDQTQHSPYGVSKLAADLYVQEYAKTYGLRTGVFRMSCIYGENQFGVEDQGWVAWFTIAALTGQPITIYGDGKQVRDVLYISDLINAFELFLQSNASGVFNIGGGKDNTLSLLELLKILETLTGKKPNISFTDWRTADQRVYVSDIRKAKEQLKWRPNITPLEGVKRLVSWASRVLL